MSIRRTIEYKGFDGFWEMNVNWDNTVDVRFNDSYWRTYDVFVKNDKIVKIEHDTEYVTLTEEDGCFIQFKFEIDGGIVADAFYKNGEFMDTLACYSFNHD